MKQSTNTPSPWHMVPSVAGLIGRAKTLVFETVLFPLGIQGATTVGRWLVGDAPVDFRRSDDAVFSFPAADSYYGHYLYRGVPYEPEIAFLIDHSGMGNLVDCGANFGYWPCYATRLGGTVVAVELSPRNYAWLARNAALNRNRFVALNAAAWSDDGVTIDMVGGVRSHAGQSGRPGSIGVPSRSVDSLVIEHSLDPAKTIVKIDCEGAEAEVLAGARRTAEGGGLFVIEEHGKDPTCGLARHMEAAGWKLHWWNGRWVPTDVAGIAAAKTDPRKGYNILAHRPTVTLPPSLM